VLSAASAARARPTRPRFEPTDLELEDPGVAEFDLQFGVTHGDGDGGNRLILPDFELDLGLTPNIEFDLDGAFSIDRFDQPTRHLAGEALWPAAKLGLFDSRAASGNDSFALGVQLGPRIPTFGTRGVGYAALGLVGLNQGHFHGVLNAGGIVDPGQRITRGQSESVVAGLDVDLDLDDQNTWSFISEFAVAHYVSTDPDEVSLSAGAAYDPTDRFELSLIVLGGFLPGADRISVLLGVSPKASLF